MATGGGNPYLPPEIIFNVLKRLPVKSLLRFRAVCKDWRDLVKSPYFIEEHYHHSALNNPLLIFQAFFGGIRRIASLFLLRCDLETVEVMRMKEVDPLRSLCRTIGSSKGLLCVAIDSKKVLLLINPATREVRQVPRSTNDDGPSYFFGQGFGYSPVVKDYKVVIIHSSRIDNISDGVEVFSLKTGSWKEVEFGVMQTVRLQSKPVTVIGTIFWLGLDVEDRRRVIVSFDLAMEVFALIPLPSPTSVTPINTIVLDVYENKLAILHRYLAHKSVFIDLWVSEEGSAAYGKSWTWTKKYSIGPTLSSLYPICLWRNEIFCQNLESLTTNNELKKFHNSLPIGGVVSNVIGGHFYVESLVPMCNTYV